MENTMLIKPRSESYIMVSNIISELHNLYEDYDYQMEESTDSEMKCYFEGKLAAYQHCIKKLTILKNNLDISK